MNFRNVDLNLLTVFDAIMAEGNMTRAADKIGMSQPAMSLALSRLRHVVGDPLFERKGRGLKPTIRALKLAQPVRQALDIMADALSPDTDFDCTSSEREFNLVLSDLGEVVFLPRIMPWIKSQQAKVRLNLHPIAQQDFKKEMHFGNIDLFLWSIPIKDPEIKYQQIGSASHSCLVRENHPLIKDSINLEQYTELEHIIIKWPEQHGPTIIDQQVRAAGKERSIALQVHSYFDVPRVLSATDMICSLPTDIAKSFAETHKLKIIPLPFEKLELPIYLMWHQNVDQDPGHKWLRNFIINLGTRL